MSENQTETRTRDVECCDAAALMALRNLEHVPQSISRDNAIKSIEWAVKRAKLGNINIQQARMQEEPAEQSPTPTPSIEERAREACNSAIDELFNPPLGTASKRARAKIAAAMSELMADQQRELERLNQMLRDTGYGQGQIDAYVAQCEDNDRLQAENTRLREACRIAFDYIDGKNYRLIQTREALEAALAQPSREEEDQ